MSVKTINGLTVASAKTIRGLTNASVKAINGNTVDHGPSAAPSSLAGTPSAFYYQSVYGGVCANVDLTWTNGDATAETRIYTVDAGLINTAAAGATSISLAAYGCGTDLNNITVKHYKNGIESAASNTVGTVHIPARGTVTLGYGQSEWIFPNTWNSSNNLIEVIGPGGAGATGVPGAGGQGGGGGGSGESVVKTNVPFGNGSFTLSIGRGGIPDGYGGPIDPSGATIFYSMPTYGTIYAAAGYNTLGPSGGGGGNHNGGAGESGPYKTGGGGGGLGSAGTQGYSGAGGDGGNADVYGQGRGGDGGQFLNGWTGGSGAGGSAGGGGGGGAGAQNGDNATPGYGGFGGHGCIVFTWGD